MEKHGVVYLQMADEVRRNSMWLPVAHYASLAFLTHTLEPYKIWFFLASNSLNIFKKNSFSNTRGLFFIAYQNLTGRGC